MYNFLEFYKIIDSLGDGVICVNEQNKIEYVNQKASQVLSKTSDDCLGKSIDTCFNIHTDVSDSIILSLIESTKNTMHTRGLEKDAYLFHPNEGKVFVSASISPIRIQDSLHIVINFREITRIKKMELENREQKRNLQAIFNALPLGIIIVNKKHKVLQINPFVRNYFKVDTLKEADVLLGNLLGCTNSNNHLCGLDKRCKDCIIRQNIRKISEMEMDYTTVKVPFTFMTNNKKTEKYFEIGFVRLQQGAENQIMLIIQDITEQIHYEEKTTEAINAAKRVNKLKSQFLANISHEIRTPLNGIMGMIDLSRLMSDDPELLDNLDIAKVSSLNLLEIINRILDISKIDAGNLEIQKSTFNLETLFEEIYEENYAKSQEKGVELRMEAYDNPVKFFVSDKTRIKQVLNNLIDNAVKFTEEGSIHIQHEIKKINRTYKLIISIEDTGIGMDKTYQENLYQYFSQEDASYTRLKGGTGLGLAISKGIVEMLGGSISCESTVGKGTIFTLSFILWIAQEENDDND